MTKILYAAMGLTIAGNVLYHFAQKSVPSNLNPVIAIIANYITAILLSLGVLTVFPLRDPLLVEVKRLNWTSLGVGLAIVGVELGFLLAYRAGWRVSVASVISNATVALVLVPIGILVFRETVTLANGIGLVFCLIGLVLVVR